MFLKLKNKWIEKWPRSASKVVSWRVTVTFSNLLGAWWASGNLASGLSFAAYAIVANSILYYLHERSWNKIGWAKDINRKS